MIALLAYGHSHYSHSYGGGGGITSLIAHYVLRSAVWRFIDAMPIQWVVVCAVVAVLVLWRPWRRRSRRG